NVTESRLVFRIGLSQFRPNLLKAQLHINCTLEMVITIVNGNKNKMVRDVIGYRENQSAMIISRHGQAETTRTSISRRLPRRARRPATTKAAAISSPTTELSKIVLRSIAAG